MLLVDLKMMLGSMNEISKYSFLLAKYTYHSLVSMKHYNGSPVARVYHDSNFRDRTCQGGIIAFNVINSRGQAVGFSKVLLKINNQYEFK
jgi:hypothetical protein